MPPTGAFCEKRASRDGKTMKKKTTQINGEQKMKTTPFDSQETSRPSGIPSIQHDNGNPLDQMRTLLLVVAAGPDLVRRLWPDDAARLPDFEALASRHAAADGMADDGERKLARLELRAELFTRLNLLLFVAERAQ
jgi:hypothetical protein